LADTGQATAKYENVPCQAYFHVFGGFLAYVLPEHLRAEIATANNFEVGPTGYDVQFGLSRDYDKGAQTSVALHTSGLVVEFHKASGQFNTGIWFHVGKLSGTSINWGVSQGFGANGYWPTVAISKEGHVIVVYSTSQFSPGSGLRYRVGTIDPAGNENQTIQWRTNILDWDGGFHSSVAINENGVIVAVHESASSNRQLY
jgi:hypothetical protein